MIQTTIGIDGMMCEMCEAHINDAIRRSFAVKSAKSNRKKKQCVVVSDEPLDEAKVRELVGPEFRKWGATGYYAPFIFPKGHWYDEVVWDEFTKVREELRGTY